VTSTGPDGESPSSLEVSATPTGSMSIVLQAPTPDGLVDSVFEVAARVTSVNQLAGVTAQIGSASTPLTFDSDDGRWEGSVSFGDAPSPSAHQLVVVATDVQGNTAQVAPSVRYDRPPRVTLEFPVPGAVATPSSRVKASCRDDGPNGCTDLIIVGATFPSNEFVLLTGTADIDQTLSFAGFDGQAIELRARGRDGAMQVRTVAESLYVDASAHLTPVASAGSGALVNADADRLLVVDRSSAGDNLRLVERPSTTGTVVFTQPAPDVILKAYLTPPGALLLTGPTSPVTPTLYELRNGMVTTLSSGDEMLTDVQVNGVFATWSTGPLRTPQTILIRRDLLAGANVTVATNAGNFGNGLAGNGDVAYWTFDPDHNVFLSHGGVTSPVTSDGRSFYAQLDGSHLVYVRNARTSGVVSPPFSIVLSDPGSDIVLATFTDDRVPDPGPAFQVNGGWIAFTRPDLANTRQVWVRSPVGVETQASAFGGESRIDVLSPTGEVVFRSAATGAVRRYRASAGGGAVDIGSGLGRALHIGGQLHVMIGATLFRVD